MEFARKICYCIKGMDECKMISPHHFHPTNGVGPSNFKFIAADIRFGHDVGLWPFAGFLGLVGPGDSCPLAEAFEKSKR